MPVIFVSPSRILNLCSPRYLPEISLRWRGNEEWHSPKYDPVRALMERTYVAAMAEHYERLADDVARRGILDPVHLTQGPLMYRDAREIPPGSPDFVCERLGGSRIMVAEILGLSVPALVNVPVEIPTRFSHMPDGYTMEEQCRRRNAAVAMVKREVAAWLATND